MSILYKTPSSMKIRWSCLLIYFLFLGSRIAFHHLQHVSVSNEAFSNDVLQSEYHVDGTESQIYDFRRHLLAMKVVRSPPNSSCTPLAVENFPTDAFTQQQRQRGAVIFHIICSMYMFFALAILCDEYFIPCLERISEVLHLQPDVAGATFMAAGSSAPELATTLVGVFIAKDDIGLGAVVGSADFNVMLVVSVTALFAGKVIYLNWWPLVRDCSFYLVSIVILALVIIDEFIYWYEALVLLIIYGLYVAFMYFNPRIDQFWRIWCHNHPTCCPRALHTEEEEEETVQQHSGAFSYPNPSSVLQSFQEPLPSYERLAGDEKKAGSFAAIDVGIDNVTVDSMDRSSSLAKGPTSLSEVETQISAAEDSWFDACFSPLILPASRGVRGRIMNCARLFVWPIRLVLCLTIPDVRKSKWQRIAVSPWISFVLCCFWIGFFTAIMMWMITVIGVTFHIPDTIMGLTFIAAGSSVPDAIASVLVVREGEGDMAVSNAVGSNVFDILICMGLPWFLKCVISGSPVIIYSKGLLYAVLTLFSTVLFLLAATHMNRWRLTKTYGVVLLVGYFVVLVFCSCYELNLFGTVHLPECPLKELS